MLSPESRKREPKHPHLQREGIDSDFLSSEINALQNARKKEKKDKKRNYPLRGVVFKTKSPGVDNYIAIAGLHPTRKDREVFRQEQKELRKIRRQNRRDNLKKTIYKTKEQARVPLKKTTEIVTFSLLKTAEKAGPPISKSIDFLSEKAYKSALKDIDRMHQQKRGAGKILPYEQWYFKEYKEELEKDGLSNPHDRNTWRKLKDKKEIGTVDMLVDCIQAHTVIPKKDLLQLANQSTTRSDRQMWLDYNAEFQSLIKDWLIQFPPLVLAGGMKNGAWSAMGNVPDQQALAAGGSAALGIYINAFIKGHDLPNHIGRLKKEVTPKLERWRREQKSALTTFNTEGNITDIIADIFDGGRNHIMKTMDEGYAIGTGVGIALAQGITLFDAPKKMILNLGITAATAAFMKKIFTWNLSRVADFQASQDELIELRARLPREDHNPQLDNDIKDARNRTVGKVAQANVLKETGINAAPWVATMAGGDPFPAAVVASAMAAFGDLSRDTLIKEGEDARKILRKMINHVSTSDYRAPSYTEIEAAREKLERSRSVDKPIKTKEEAFAVMSGGQLRIAKLENRSDQVQIKIADGMMVLGAGYNLVLAPSGIDGGKSDFIDRITLNLGDISRSEIYLNNINLLWLDPEIRKELFYNVVTSSSESKKTFAEELIDFVNDSERNDFNDMLSEVQRACQDRRHMLVKQYGLKKVQEISRILLSSDDPRKAALIGKEGWLTYLKKWTHPDPKKRAQYRDPKDLSDEALASVLLTETFLKETGELFNFKSETDAIRYLATKPGEGTSSGEHKAWDIWKGLAKKRLVIVLDEPTSNLSRIGVNGQPSIYLRVARHIDKRLRKHPDTIFLMIDHYRDYIDFMQGWGINFVLSVKNTESDGKKHILWSATRVDYINFDEAVQEYYGDNGQLQ